MFTLVVCSIITPNSIQGSVSRPMDAREEAIAVWLGAGAEPRSKIEARRNHYTLHPKPSHALAKGLKEIVIRGAGTNRSKSV